MKTLFLIISAAIVVIIWRLEVKSILEEMEGEEDEESTEDYEH